MLQWLHPFMWLAVFVLPFLLMRPIQAPEGLVSQGALDYIELIRTRYDVPGISIGIIASPEFTGHGWKNETHGFGYMNSQGRAVDGDVSASCSRTKGFG